MSTEEKFYKDCLDRNILVEKCLGCGKIGCDGCPAGTVDVLNPNLMVSELFVEIKTYMDKLNNISSNPNVWLEILGNDIESITKKYRKNNDILEYMEDLFELAAKILRIIEKLRNQH